MTAARKRRVLVVDDEVHVARTLKLGLDLHGAYDVRIETRGANALAAAREFEPDLVILDVLMPDRRGEDVLLELRADTRFAGVPVVFLTATSPDDCRANVRPDGWIQKPATAAQVIAHMEGRFGARPPKTGGE